MPCPAYILIALQMPASHLALIVRSRMSLSMLSRRDAFEIIDGVVSRISINVVDVESIGDGAMHLRPYRPMEICLTSGLRRFAEVGRE